LVELGQHSADDLAAHLEEYRRLFQIAQQVEAEHDARVQQAESGA
jgi:hypothetical protein